MASLTVSAVRAARHPGGNARPVRIGDGEGLYLQIASAGSKSWLYRFTMAGKAREMGLGAVATSTAEEQAGGITLAAAREAARAAKSMLRQGRDPIDTRDAERRSKQATAPIHTFSSVTDLFIAAHSAGWRGPKVAKLWKATLETYAFPFMGETPVAAIGTGEVTAALEPIWREKPETAARVRGRMEAVLDYAAARGWRAGDNPARWRGHLDKLLPARGKVAKVEHRPALAWSEAGAFLAELRKRDGSAARALELATLTAGRTAEILGMRWGEVDFATRLWIVPAERMKMGREHRVPLSAPALDLLRALSPVERNPLAADTLVFPGERAGRPLSSMAMLMLLRRMNPVLAGGKARWRDARTGEPITPHGMRSCFRDWVAERTGFPRELAEAALAHTLGSRVEAAYQRGDMLEKRRRLMEDWGRFCARPMQPAEVTPLRRAAGG